MAEPIVDARTAALTALFDDASTLAPTRRDPADALAAHAVRRAGRDAWATARLVITTDAALELPDVLGDALGDGDPVELAVVLTRSGVGSLAPVVRADVGRLTPLTTDDRATVAELEMTLSGSDPIADIREVTAAAAAAGLDPDTPLACEIPLAGRPAGEVVQRINVVADARDEGAPLLVKLRLAGTLAGTVPTEVEVAGFLRACADAQMPLVVAVGAAGVGRAVGAPRPAEDDGPPAAGDGAPTHGVLNVLGAAALAYRGEGLTQIQQALAQPLEQIRLGPGALIVGVSVLDSEVLADVRRDFLQTISCADVDATMRQLRGMGALEDGEAPA